MSNSRGLKDPCAIVPRRTHLRLLFGWDSSLMLVFVRMFAAAVDCFKYVEWSRKSVWFRQLPRGKSPHLLCIVERRRRVFLRYRKNKWIERWQYEFTEYIIFSHLDTYPEKWCVLQATAWLHHKSLSTGQSIVNDFLNENNMFVIVRSSRCRQE